MPKYQKAFQLKQLRDFPGWNEDRYSPAEAAPGSEAPQELDDETIVFVHENLIVTRRNNQPVYLRDIAEVSTELWPRNGFMYRTGFPAYYIRVQGKYGANTVTVLDEINQVMEEFRDFATVHGFLKEGGTEYAIRLIERSFAPEKASQLRKIVESAPKRPAGPSGSGALAVNTSSTPSSTA